MKFKDNPFLLFRQSHRYFSPHGMAVPRNTLSTMRREIPHTQGQLLLNDTSNMKLTINECRQILADLTAAKI